MSSVRNNWKNELQPTADCLKIERLAEALTPGEQEHVAGCLRCQTETALWKDFLQTAVAPHEAAAVQAVAAEIRRRASHPSNVVPFAARRNAFRPRTLAAAAMLVLAVTIGYVVENREPAVNDRLSRETLYRSARIEAVTPTGDLPAAPAELRWAPVAGATSYDVSIFEIDHTVLWQTTTREARAPLPAAVIAKFVPGKPIQWTVAARRDSNTLAQSATQQFRVTNDSR